MTNEDLIDALFRGKEPAVRATYDTLLQAVARLGPASAEPKKASIHLVRRTTFAGVHPRMKWLDLTLRTEAALDSPRLRAQEQVSRNRWHQDVRLTRPNDVDPEVRKWLRQSFELAG